MALSTVKIGGNTYQVIHKKEPVVGNKYVHGSIDYCNRTIIIDNTGDTNQQKNTMLHECIHGVLEDRNVSQNENLVFNLANGLTALFRDNPKLAKFLLS